MIDFQNDPEFIKYSDFVCDDLYPKIKNSFIFTVLITPNFKADSKVCTEVGVALLLGKKIVCIKHINENLPDKLLKVISNVIDIDFTNEESKRKDLQKICDYLAQSNETESNSEASDVNPIRFGRTQFATLALQVGATLFFDKPLIMGIQPGLRIPERLVDIADRIVECDEHTDIEHSIEQAVKEIEEDRKQHGNDHENMKN